MDEKRFNNSEVTSNGNSPENARKIFTNKRFDIAGAIKYRFEDGVKKTVAIGTNPGGKLMVYVDGRYFVTEITDTVREEMVNTREQLNSNIEDQVQTALQERYRSGEYQEVGR